MQCQLSHRAVALADIQRTVRTSQGHTPRLPLLSPSCLPCDHIQNPKFQLNLSLPIQNSALLPQGPAEAVRQYVFQEHGASALDTHELSFSVTRQAALLSGYAALLVQSYRPLLNSSSKHGLLDPEGRQ